MLHSLNKRRRGGLFLLHLLCPVLIIYPLQKSHLDPRLIETQPLKVTMLGQWLLGAVFTLCLVLGGAERSHFYWDYIVVGAGPGGLQLGYFLHQANRNYILLERANISGSFYSVYPRHNRLISINKRHTGRSNKEFNLRHDWNSLLSHDESLQLRHYTREFFPSRDVMERYLNDYQRKLGIKVRFNTDVRDVARVFNSTLDTHAYIMKDNLGNTYACRTLILATGMGKANTPNFEGHEHTESYEDISTNPDDFEGQSVLILGRGNSAFEVADSIYGSTNLIHMLGRSRVRLSWATHYVGDLRAVNNGLLDTYQLKSLDGVLEAPMEEVKVTKDNNKFRVTLVEKDSDKSGLDMYDNFALRDSYDRVIRCLGWQFDDSLLRNDTHLQRGSGRKKKYPAVKHNYESVSLPGLFFAGTNTHGLDFRKSSGGFIHGFRYTAQTLFHLLEWRNNGVKWPSMKGSMDQLVNIIIKRINEASGTYQMFGELGDVVAIRNGGQEFEYIEQFPLRLLSEFTSYSGHDVDRTIVVSMEYGANFSGPGKDIFRIDRAVGEPREAHKSNFLHPVLYYYTRLPTEAAFANRRWWENLPRPKRIHHMVEDFLTLWEAPTSHILPLRRFIETILREDLRQFFAEDCLKLALAFQTLPRTCEKYYLNGEGLQGTEELLHAAQHSGLLL